MSDNFLQKGFDDLLKPQNQYKSDRKYSQYIYGAAWGVEIIASLIGLFFAWSTGYNAYFQIEENERTTQTLIFAIQGALPFLLIAIIEPLKIPLAAGLYKVRIIGWKILILITLLGLTTITFETMFTSLEQNLTNVTQSVIKQSNTIKRINSTITELEEEKVRIQNSSDDKISLEIRKQIDEQESALNLKIDTLEDELKKNIEPKERQRNENLISIQEITVQDPNLKAKVDLLNGQIDNKRKNLEKLRKDKDSQISELRNEGKNINDIKNQAVKSKVSNFKDLVEKEENNKNQALKERRDLREVISKRIEKLQSSHSEKISKLTIEKKEALLEAPFGTRGKVERTFDKAINDENVSFDQQKKNIYETQDEDLKSLDNTIKNYDNRIKEYNDEIQKLLNDNREEPTSKIDNEAEINELTKNFNSRITALEAEISSLNSQLNDLLTTATKNNNAQVNKFLKQNEILNQQIDAAIKKTNTEIEETKTSFNKRINELRTKEQKQILDLAEDRETKLPLINKEITLLTREMNEAKDEKRIEAQKSQVYRFAAWWFKVEDLVDVNKKQLNFASLLWFGSISLIAGTIGTVLALIHYIVDDPNNYKKESKIKYFKRLKVLTLLFFRKIISLIRSLTKMLIALVRVLLSFAEIFRGLVGRPMQRSIRKTLLALRKKLNNPRIEVKEKIVEKEVIVEVEKEVPVEVEKIVEKIKEVPVEVEKIVEKIKEVPVEKVEIKEVPKEIVHKKLVYVPLFSTEKGLVDAPDELKKDKNE